MHRFVELFCCRLRTGPLPQQGSRSLSPSTNPVQRLGLQDGHFGRLDGDLVVAWTSWTGLEWRNDGLGGLVPTAKSRDKCPSLLGRPSTGTGSWIWPFRLNLELWHNRGEDGFATILQLPNTGFIGLADGEGDGDVDLLVV